MGWRDARDCRGLQFFGLWKPNDLVLHVAWVDCISIVEGARGLIFSPRDSFIHSFGAFVYPPPDFVLFLSVCVDGYGSQRARMADDRDRLGLGCSVSDLRGASRLRSVPPESRLRRR